MNKLVEALKQTKIFYVATVDGDKPDVRPFSSVCEFEGNAYICTNNTKKVWRQIQANPNISISGMLPGGWLRVEATAVRDDRDEARKAMLDDPTGPSQIYTLGDGIFEVLRLENVKAVKDAFNPADKEVIV